MMSSSPSSSLDEAVGNKNSRVTDFSIERLLSTKSTASQHERANQPQKRERQGYGATCGNLSSHPDNGAKVSDEGMVKPWCVDGGASSDVNTIRPEATSNGREKLYPCALCNYRTDRRNNLERHAKTMHSSLNEPHECCDQKFRNKAALRQHTKLCHQNGYSCLRCGKSFPRRALLARHASIHSGIKRHRCWFCGYATSHKSNFDRHLRVHRSVSHLQHHLSTATDPTSSSALPIEGKHELQLVQHSHQSLAASHPPGVWLRVRNPQQSSLFLAGLEFHNLRMQQPALNAINLRIAQSFATADQVTSISSIGQGGLTNVITQHGNTGRS